MSLSQRILLLAGAVAILLVIVQSVRKKRILIEDSLFWLAFSAFLVLVGIFPQIVYVFSRTFHFQSPANLVFAAVIAILIVREFRNTAKISLLTDRVNQLAQDSAIAHAEAQASTDKAAEKDDPQA